MIIKLGSLLIFFLNYVEVSGKVYWLKGPMDLCFLHIFDFGEWLISKNFSGGWLNTLRDAIIVTDVCFLWPYDRIRLHTESGREERRVQFRCRTARTDSREKASGRFWRRRGHCQVGPKNHIRTLSAVRCSLSISRGGLAPHRIPSPRCHPPLQNSHDVRWRRQLCKANHEGSRPHAIKSPKVCPYSHQPLISIPFVWIKWSCQTSPKLYPEIEIFRYDLYLNLCVIN